VTAWLECDVEPRAFGFGTGLFERDNLGVIAAGESVVAGADDFAAANQHGADGGIGAGATGSFPR
jgi:hypothetical protein